LHCEALKKFWFVNWPHEEFELVSEKWRDLGFQVNDCSTDFRGGGLLSLE
jgi:hypothetical protein